MNIFLPPLRPPGALGEAKFRTACIRCGRCIEVCPHKAVRMSAKVDPGMLLPYVDAAQAPCQLCMKCPPACPTGALKADCVAMEDAGMGTAYILESRCLNRTVGTMCWTCYDRCPLRGKAIVLENGLMPVITKACVGCGICEHVCPHQAVTVIAASVNFKPEDAVPLAEIP